MASLGALTGLGAPLGLLIVRAFGRDGPLTLDWCAGELVTNAAIYLYAAFTAVSILALIGKVAADRFERFERSSVTDPLTGIANRRLFDERLSQEVAGRARNRRPFTLLIVDLDNLKAINDLRGHRAGDEALKSVAFALEHCARRSDVSARIGGDEFAVIASRVGPEDGVKMAQRIQTAVHDAGFSVSIGVAGATDAIESARPDAVFAAADRALYAAKAMGRDCVCVAHDADPVRIQPDVSRSMLPERNGILPHVASRALRTILGWAVIGADYYASTVEILSGARRRVGRRRDPQRRHRRQHPIALAPDHFVESAPAGRTRRWRARNGLGGFVSRTSQLVVAASTKSGTASKYGSAARTWVTIAPSMTTLSSTVPRI